MPEHVHQLLIISTPTVACSLEIYYAHVRPLASSRFRSLAHSVCAASSYVSNYKPLALQQEKHIAPLLRFTSNILIELEKVY